MFVLYLDIVSFQQQPSTQCAHTSSIIFGKYLFRLIWIANNTAAFAKQLKHQQSQVSSSCHPDNVPFVKMWCALRYYFCFWSLAQFDLPFFKRKTPFTHFTLLMFFSFLSIFPFESWVFEICNRRTAMRFYWWIVWLQ